MLDGENALMSKSTNAYTDPSFASKNKDRTFGYDISNPDFDDGMSYQSKYKNGSHEPKDGALNSNFTIDLRNAIDMANNNNSE